MRFSTAITAALCALASALPSPQIDEQPGREFALSQIGTGVIVPYCRQHPLTRTPCPAVLKSGNVLITSRSKIIDARYPDGEKKAADGTPIPGPIYHETSFGFRYQGGNKHYEVRSYAVFRNFPELARGKQCRFHFITDDGSNPELHDRINVYTVRSGKVTDQTTWNHHPERGDLVAAFEIKPNKFSRVQGSTKLDHFFLSGSGYPLHGSFPCPAPGKDYAWEMAPDYTPRPETQTLLFSGGQNGLGLEILDTPQTGYLPGTVPICKSASH